MSQLIPGECLCRHKASPGKTVQCRRSRRIHISHSKMLHGADNPCGTKHLELELKRAATYGQFVQLRALLCILLKILVPSGCRPLEMWDVICSRKYPLSWLMWQPLLRKNAWLKEKLAQVNSREISKPGLAKSAGCPLSIWGIEILGKENFWPVPVRYSLKIWAWSIDTEVLNTD